MAEKTPDGDTLDLVWGAKEIGRLIGKAPMATFHLLGQGKIPGSRKIGSQWVISKKALREHFERVDA